jgi:dihydroorotate dehydrogenase
MAKYMLTKKRSTSWETLKEGESIIIDITTSSLHYSDVSKYLEKIGKKPKVIELNLSSFDVQKL